MKLDICFLVPGLPFDGNTLTSHSLGGSETAGLCMARELAARGHNVYMFCNTPNSDIVYEGVVYLSTDKWTQYATNTIHDIAIVQRAPNIFTSRLLSKLNILWCHDLATARQFQQVRGSMWNIDGVFVLSEFMKNQYKEVYALSDNNLWLTRNGLNLDLFPGYGIDRDKKKLIYSARPERGLDVLVDKIVPILFNEDPEYKLYIYGYDNPTDQFKNFYGELSAKCRPWGDRIIHGGNLSKSDLYKVYSSGGVYVYPTPSPVMPDFVEVSCISAMEAQAAGLPIVTSNRGALSETITEGAGYLIDGDPLSDEYTNSFCNAVRELVNNDSQYQYFSDTGIKHAQNLSWSKVAEEWENKFYEEIDKNNDNPIRLARHFIRRSDIYAAEKAIKGHEDDPGGVETIDIINNFYSWKDSDSDFAEHYKKGGLDTDARLSDREDPAHLFEHTSEERFHYFERILQHYKGIHSILDYGCGHGWCDVYLHNKTGKKVVGVDIDPNAAKWSRNYADKFAKNPEDLDFYSGSVADLELFNKLKNHDLFDCLIISEVLEHVRNPVETVNALLPFVKDGGIVIITTPYGPSEYGTYNWEKFRNHLWEFDPHDLDDMFGHMDNMDLNVRPEKTNIHTGEVVGFHAISFVKSDKIVNPINWERKLRLQRPTQTLSVAIMAGGPFVEETAHWMMRSVQAIANEIIVADNGMSDEARRIISQYGAKIIPGKNPLVEGFGPARNVPLEECVMDWVLWIDCDEKLVDPFHTTKYLRNNMFDGYAVKQHHLTIDAGFKPDMPSRLFRNNKGEDRIQFYGYIHEHPEKALNAGVGEVIIIADMHIAHVGYMSETSRRQRFWRNHPLLQKDIEAYPDRLLQKHFIMRDNMLKCSFELQQNGGVITEEMKVRAEETKNIFRKYFLGKPSHLNSDSLTYYSQALEVLGEGFEISFDIAAARDGIGDQLNGGTRARFASFEEVNSELSWRLKDKIDPLTKKWW